ncbi:MAG TPA: ADP-forming succinate--CoA ligase subunit beta [bacterium]|nr:ADP-forming succinate--CoA ligase subunit beta [bacterium]HPR88549.1 ADP-forming succinate--CoA ligase subunit beta [bacterium]
MKIHEYQAKELLARHGVPVQKGAVAYKPREVRRLVEKMELPRVVLKAQVHAGGRGKAGGIKVADSAVEAEELAGKMFGMKLVTPQTSAEGKIVRRILVTEAADIARELYAGIVLDRSRRELVFMVSQAGGVEIEKVAEEHPEQIIKEYIDRAAGLQAFQARRLAFALDLTGPLFRPAVQLFLDLYKAYIACDATLLEINPLVVTPDQKLLALDVKFNIDDNALFRHPEIQGMRDTDEEEPLEVEASKSNLNYIKLDGNVGCMVNGAGLAMATMDIIKLAGAEPANFLDVGGGASAETVENGFRIILSDKHVQAVLINIFGGIVRCDRVARGVIEAVKKGGIRIPVVVRLAGTNAEEAAVLLEESGMNFGVAKDLAEAARLVVAALHSA